MNVVRRWRKYLAVGCNHGPFICPQARKAVMDFKADYKPNHVIHLGDFLDQTALRSGAFGTKDQSASIQKDLTAGLDFLRELEPKWIFEGNHEDRVYRYSHCLDAVKAFAASRIIQDLHELRDELKAELISYNIDTGWRELGNHLFGHGYLYNEAAIRDHAELVGNCVIAHLHRTGEERGRRRGGATGYCVGLLADIPSLDYAKTHKATMKWQNAFAYGEWTDGATTVNLVKRADNGQWRLP